MQAVQFVFSDNKHSSSLTQHPVHRDSLDAAPASPTDTQCSVLSCSTIYSSQHDHTTSRVDMTPIRRVASINRSRSFQSQHQPSPAAMARIEDTVYSKPVNNSTFSSLLSLTNRNSNFSKKLHLLKSWWSRYEKLSPLPLIPCDLSMPEKSPSIANMLSTKLKRRGQRVKRSLSNQDFDTMTKSLGNIHTHDMLDDASHNLYSSSATLLNVPENSLLPEDDHCGRSFTSSCDMDMSDRHHLGQTPNLSDSSSTVSLHYPPSSMGIPELQTNMNSNRLNRSITNVNRYSFVGPYRILKVLGSGSFSTVRLALDTTTDSFVAIKFISKSLLRENMQMNTSVENEISIMKKLAHPNIVNIIDSFETREDVCIVMEYIEGGELFSTIAYHFDSMSEQRAKHIFRQLAEVVKYLHDQNICHRDLKLENVLLDNSDNVKLTDFGFAKAFRDNVPLTARCGSEEYAAPEIILGTPYDGRKVDVWALGVILFAMLTGELPFNMEQDEKPKAMYHRIARGEFKFPEDRKESAGSSDVRKVNSIAKDLIRSMLKQNASRRFLLNDVLEHPWLSSV